MSTIINATTTNGVVIQPDNSGSLQLATNSGTTALTIDTSQNVGIGTTSPDGNLHVYKNAAASLIRVTSSTTGVAGVDFGDTNAVDRGQVRYFNNGDYLLLATANTERMRIDSSGRVTMPYQPAFFVRKTNGGAMSPVNPVLFNDVVTNVGSYYDASTGRFTAPVAGNYYFISTAHVETTNNDQRTVNIYVNGVSRAYAYILNATGARIRIVATSILTLAANDYVTVGTGISDFWAGDSSGINFSGYLIG